jgi:hypothetical protein
MATKAELETELKVYRAGWRDKTVAIVAADISHLRAVASMVFERGFDTEEERVAYQLGVRDVQQELTLEGEKK